MTKGKGGKGSKKTKKSPSKRKPGDPAEDAGDPPEDTTLPAVASYPADVLGESGTPAPDLDPAEGDGQRTSPPPTDPPPGPGTDPIPESSPAPRLPKIQLRVFEKIAGPKWDQLAGFKQYAKANSLGPMTVPEWRVALQAFKNKPT